MEDNQESEARLAVLQEEVAAAQAEKDAEVMAAVKALQEKLAAHGDERIQTMLRSAGGEQIMRGRGGKQKQSMSDSPRGKQTME